jgi:undecaprenyl phosphate N,N'-diacetylbacillosamine 1-phosphate transferase
MFPDGFVKRVIDIFLALLALLLAFIPGIILLIVAKIQFGKAFFLQERIGKNEAIFLIYKVKSLGPNHELTPFWMRVRSAGLDEIPQCWNILKGEMSWIGPRPLLPEYLNYYNEAQKRRHLVSPGIFGWSQLHQMQKLLTWEDRLALDVEYVERRNLGFDLRIFISSVFLLLTKARKNASDFERFGT